MGCKKPQPLEIWSYASGGKAAILHENYGDVAPKYQVVFSTNPNRVFGVMASELIEKIGTFSPFDLEKNDMDIKTDESSPTKDERVKKEKSSYNIRREAWEVLFKLARLYERNPAIISPAIHCIRMLLVDMGEDEPIGKWSYLFFSPRDQVRIRRALFASGWPDDGIP